jgi:hypothetical protein
MPEPLEQLHKSYLQGLEEAALQPEPPAEANQDQVRGSARCVVVLIYRRADGYLDALAGSDV